MARIILVTGGCRSGKSAFALQIGNLQGKSRLFLATCPITDPEMADRIKRHQTQRDQQGWQTLEQEINLDQVLTEYSEQEVVLIDCLTLWVNNLLYTATTTDQVITEQDINDYTTALLSAAAKRSGTVVMVSSEVGMGLVPASAQTRLYRDLIGRCNQNIAARADEVYLVCCGIPMQLKG